MGKSLKKSKSDRINALRKQYDAFLDEDKKRKDRNEFILGRLEKMRLCSTVAPHMGNPIISNYYNASPVRPDYRSNIARFDNRQVLLSRPPNLLTDSVVKDEQMILKEISKKFILIPKFRSTNESSMNEMITYYNTPSASNDTDWKNKYNILDELKQIEKEEPSENSEKQTYDIDVKSKHDLSGFKQENIMRNQNYNSQVTEKIPESKLINDTQPIYQKGSANELKRTHSNINFKLPIEPKDGLISNIENNQIQTEVTTIPDLGTLNQTQYQVADLDNTNKEFYPQNLMTNQIHEKEGTTNLLTNQVQEVQQNKLKGTNDIIGQINNNKDYEGLSNKQLQDNNFVQRNKDQTSNKVNSEQITQIMQNNSRQLSETQTVTSDDTVNLNENVEINLKSSEINTATKLFETTENQIPSGGIEQLSENTVQQEYNPNDETIVSDNIVTSQIDEFEAEQKEMFYSEDTEYNQNVEYNPQNEQYTNEQYSYYNEAPQEQAYYAEVNEHEESTERYDPNYEQQYVNNYEQSADVVQYENQEYNVENYANQQEVTTENYEQHAGNFEYEQSASINPDHNNSENVNAYESHASEIETQPSQNPAEDEQSGALNSQNAFESQQEYVQMHTEEETLQNMEKELDMEDGYDTNNQVPNLNNDMEKLATAQEGIPSPK